MKKLYGSTAEVIASLIGIALSSLIVVKQLSAIGEYASHILSISPATAILGFGSFVVLYSCIGGMRSVATTDVVQLVLITFALVVLADVALHHVGGHTSLT